MNRVRFDRHDWNAKLYTSNKEIDAALKSFKVFEKSIKDIHVIGMAVNMEKGAYERRARNTLADIGMPYEYIDSGKYPYLDDTVLPCKVKICEPVVFIFDDNTTLEIMPCGKRGLFMSANEISPDVLDGTNFHNFDSTKLFERVFGSSVKRVQVINTLITIKSGANVYEEARASIKYQVRLTGDFGVYFEQESEGWYEFGLTDQHWFMNLGNKTADTTLGEIKKAANNKRQITIVEGHDSSSYFWIMPVKHVPVTKESSQGIEEYRKEQISIEEDDVSSFLYYFLNKYYDADYPYGDSRDEYCENTFQWYLEYNIYTYDTMSTMLSDIEECCNLLKNDYNNIKLDGLKKRFSAYDFEPDILDSERMLSEEEKADIIKNNIYIATEFYERFVYRMRGMMANSTDYNLISFMGP